MELRCLFLFWCLYQFVNTETASISTKLLIEAINAKKTTWKAGYNFPEGSSREFFKQRLGFLGNHPDPNFEVDVKQHKVRATIPETFDAREQWPICKDVIDDIRNQGNCGSCWAFSATEVMTDKLCIQTNGKTKFQFSPQDLLSCCTYCVHGHGCGGGYAYFAWNYWLLAGIVSGGDYDSNKGCRPYEAEAFNDNITPSCKVTCPNLNYTVSYTDDKHFGGAFYRLKALDVQQIQTEIMTNGPVQADYIVYEDFMYYSEGVYQHVEGVQLRPHAVKIIGWGTEAGTPYWLAANSWGTDWGNLHGYFKIKRGSNECQIEENVISGAAYVASDRDDGTGGSSVIKVVSSTLGLFLTGLIFFYM